MLGLAIMAAILGGAFALVWYGSRQKPKLGWNDSADPLGEGASGPGGNESGVGHDSHGGDD